MYKWALCNEIYNFIYNSVVIDMFKKIKLTDINDYFKKISERQEGGVYFTRIVTYGKNTEKFIKRYLKEAKNDGIYLYDKIEIPTQKEILSLKDILDNNDAFEIEILDDKGFLQVDKLEQNTAYSPLFCVEKRNNFSQIDKSRQNIVLQAIDDTVKKMTMKETNINLVENFYLTMMYWIYYKFMVVFRKNKYGKTFKVLYVGDINEYELALMSIFSKIGLDVVIVLCNGSNEYNKIDPQSNISDLFDCKETKKIPPNFSIKTLEAAIESEGIFNEKIRNLYPVDTVITNSWLPIKAEKLPDHFLLDFLEIGTKYEETFSEKIDDLNPVDIPIPNSLSADYILAASLKNFNERIREDKAYYNIFAKINGVDGIFDYANRLLKWKKEIIYNRKKLVIINKKIDIPNLKELEEIHINEYSNVYEMIIGLSEQIELPMYLKQNNMIKKAFIELISERVTFRYEQTKFPIAELQKIGECILCWLNTYIPLLFKHGDLKQYPSFIYFNGIISKNEAMFLRLLSKLPVDVFIISPDLKIKSEIKDQFLYIIDYDRSLSLDRFPENNEDLEYEMANNMLYINDYDKSGSLEQIPEISEDLKDGTVANKPEDQSIDISQKDLDLNKNQQFKNAIPVILETTYDEINVLWNKEAKFRPNFKSFDDKVIIPIICSKILGVPNGDIRKYFQNINDLISEESFLMIGFPHSEKNEKTELKLKYNTLFLNSRELNKDAIKKHSNYKYKSMSEPMQDYMLKCLQDLLFSGIIKGTFENETEYEIIDFILNLDINFLRLILNYDFTGKIPKLIIIDTTEDIGSIKDSILIAYARQLGFDVALFVPTGYRSVENNFSKQFFSYHNAGEYMYDLPIPNWIKSSKNMDSKSNEIKK
jgi:hypothetical protein